MNQKKRKAFLKDLLEVCRRHGVSIPPVDMCQPEDGLVIKETPNDLPDWACYYPDNYDRMTLAFVGHHDWTHSEFYVGVGKKQKRVGGDR